MVIQWFRLKLWWKDFLAVECGSQTQSNNTSLTAGVWVRSFYGDSSRVVLRYGHISTPAWLGGSSVTFLSRHRLEFSKLENKNTTSSSSPEQKVRMPTVATAINEVPVTVQRPVFREGGDEIKLQEPGTWSPCSRFGKVKNLMTTHYSSCTGQYRS